MDKEQEEAVQRITARYIAELHAGRQPRLSDYLSRYPQYADAITDFVTYYHATEVDVPGESDVIPPLTKASRVALDRAWRRILPSESATNSSLLSLQMTASNQGKSLSQLAGEIGLSLDILEKLERHVIDAATIPKEVCKRLANALRQPLVVIETYLGLAERKQLAHGLAEVQASYHVEGQPDVHIEGFWEAVEQSEQLSNEQKDTWRAIRKRERL